MTTTYSTNDLAFELPGEEWRDHSLSAAIAPDGSVSCFVSRDVGTDPETSMQSLVELVTEGAQELSIEGRRTSKLGPLECEEARVMSRENDEWLYCRVAAAKYYDQTFALAVYGQQSMRDAVDLQMDRIQREIRFRRR